MMVDSDYSETLHNKRIDFSRFDIVDGWGIPCTGSSEDSRVWVLDWIAMEQFFAPSFLNGKVSIVKSTTY
jgi:hypothetical protein